MQPCPPPPLLNRLLTDDLAPADRTVLENHVEHCPHCQAALEQLTQDSLIRSTDSAGGATRRALEPALLWRGGDVPFSQSPLLSLPKGDRLLADVGRILTPSATAGALGRLGDYDVTGIVGSGAMGIVVRAEEPGLRRPVALKLLAPYLAGSETAQLRFLREARSAAAVRHDHVVTVHAVHPGPPPFLVMELIVGETLERRLGRLGPLPVEEVLRFGREAALGLAAAHAQGLVHRDIKPSNLLVEDATGRLKITDFGLARAADDRLTGSGLVAGTPAFMAPEQARNEPLDGRADLFSLGAVLYTLCAGRPPFEAEHPLAILKRVCEADPPPLRQVNPAVPEWLEAIIRKLLAKAPGDRYPTAAAVAEALETQSPGPVAAPPPQPSSPAPPPPAPPGRRRGRRVSLAGLVLVVGGLALWAGLSRWSPPPFAPPPRRLAPPVPPPPTFTNTLGMAFVLVPRGKFWRGGGGGKPGTAEITIPYDFYLGKYEVTQEQWQAVMGFNPSHHSRQREGREEVQAVADEELKRFPVEFVSWVDVTAFLHLLNQQDATPGWRYCLPRAVEWEYACRGGPMADPAAGAFDFYLDQPGLRLDRLQANLGGALGRPCPVGRFPANPLGLHDMHGNVGEWCDDAGDWTWAPYNPADGIPTAPLPAEGPERKRPIDQAVRGGNWGRNADACRAGTWELLPTHTRDPRIGFRVARVYVGEEGSGTATGK